MHTQPMHHRSRGHRAIVASVAGAALLLLGGSRPPHAESSFATPQQVLFESANHERTARGLAQLRWDGAVAEASQRHALLMMSQNILTHQFAGESDLVSRVRRTGAHFTAIAENVAVGPSAVSVHEQWMRSPAHRENLLDPEMNSMGAAVAQRGAQLFAVEDFTESVIPMPLADQETEIATQLKLRGLHLLRNGESEMARRVCQGEAASLDHPGRMFTLRFATADLESLPPALLQELQSSRYHAAAVGACEPGRDSAYSAYQIAVLLYE